MATTPSSRDLENRPAWIVRVGDYFKAFLNALWQARISAFLVIGVYIVFWELNQGSDLLLALPEKGFWSHVRAIWSFIDISLLASTAWFIPRQALNLGNLEERRNDPWSIETKVNIFLPRFLGVMIFLLFTGAIFYLFYIIAVEQSQPDCIKTILPRPALLLFVTLLSALIVYLTQKIYSDKSVNKLSWIIIFSIMLIIGGLWVYFWFTPFLQTKLLLLAIIGLLSTFIYCFVVTIRTLSLNITWLPNLISENLEKWIRWLALFYGIVFFIAYNFVPDPTRIYPISVVATGMITYGAIATWILNKYQKYYGLTFTIIGLIVLNIFWNLRNVDLHDVVTQPVEQNTGRQMELEEHFKNWVAERETEIMASDSFPIFLVVGQGGGSRAAFWTNTVLCGLHDTTGGQFSQHLYAISTASGSSFGAGAYLTFLKEKLRLQDHLPIRKKIKPKRKKWEICANRLPFERNYLSANLAYFMGRDLWAGTFLPVFKHNREKKLEDDRNKYVGLALENMIEKPNGENIVNWFERPFLDLWGDGLKYQIPIFFPNTARVEDGKRGLVSPVIVDTTFFTDPLDIVGHLEASKESMSLSTAINLSTRFPFLNAGGKIEGLGHFVDGGYYDNLGSTSIMEVCRVLHDIQETYPDSSIYQKLRFHLVRIFNHDLRPPCNLKFNNISQMTVPIVTILQSRSAHTEYMKEFTATMLDHRLHDFVLDHTIEIEGGHFRGKVVFPLARFLSGRAAEGIEENFEQLKEGKAKKSEPNGFQEILRLLQ